MWNQSMTDTYAACYKHYYNDKHKEEAQLAAPAEHFQQARGAATAVKIDEEQTQQEQAAHGCSM